MAADVYREFTELTAASMNPEVDQMSPDEAYAWVDQQMSKEAER